MKRLAAVMLIGLTALLGACATLQPEGSGQPNATQAASPAAALSSIATADLETAALQADADGDQVGAACWRAMQAWLGSRPPAPKVVGAFSAIQAARSATRRISAGVPQDVHVKCAPLVLDAQAVALRLGLIAAGRPLLP